MLQIICPKDPFDAIVVRSGATCSIPGAAILLLIAALPSCAETYTLVADRYYRTFSHQNAVLKRIQPGDVVITKTLDSGGQDNKDVLRHPDPGNPLTGPFYIEGAQPGAAIRVTFRKMRLNRTEGYSGFRLGVFSLTPAYVVQLYSPSYKPDLVRKRFSNYVRWDV